MTFTSRHLVPGKKRPRAQLLMGALLSLFFAAAVLAVTSGAILPAVAPALPGLYKTLIPLGAALLTFVASFLTLRAFMPPSKRPMLKTTDPDTAVTVAPRNRTGQGLSQHNRPQTGPKWVLKRYQPSTGKPPCEAPAEPSSQQPRQGLRQP